MSTPDPTPRRPLDAASSEPLHPRAREVLAAALDQGWADPRRLHHEARRARMLLDNAREAAAEALDVRADEVTFTTSGTDAVHRGLLGLHAVRRRTSPAVAHSAVEHSSVVHAARWTGDPLVEVPVTPTGEVLATAVAEALASAPAPAGVLAVQSANHEVGTVHDVAAAAEVAGDVPLFVDACASLGRLPLPRGWAAAAGSSHKWGGPAGVGLLLVRKGARWRNPFPGDDRADERACGFENVPAALAAAAALQAMVQERQETAARQHALVDRIREAAAALPDVEVVGDPVRRLPHLVTFSCLYLDGESLVTELDRRGFGVASGSACTSSTLTPSHVLAAMGALTHGNLRVSLHQGTTEADVEAFLEALPEVVDELRGRITW
ncbi:aminotransferase class V-fold PLP-dependent enzyme [Nocardioides sp. Y6]|uniref:Aminotransferase class V-fold PLP-dependent enzyme n=1 Tax=Nocardioides malaquae TaxID=2773426 RepID=A0ABR9RP09_9ACTN|nr:aminotransferase class V-fold PLP-dependent enzyme [Nocardioides malaquae]MBE7323304.1 aminotransferase class V-fold PLP-dependent enzyme [Nocardioides malaquae]